MKYVRNGILLALPFILSACFISGRIAEVNSESRISGPSFKLTYPSSSTGKALTPVVTLSNIQPGDLISVYSDPTCTTLWTQATATSTSAEISIPLTYGNYHFYATISGSTASGCVDTNVTYSADFSSGKGFPLGRADGAFYTPNGVAFDSKGNIYVSDSGYRRIAKFNSSGVFITQFGSPGTGNGQFGSSSPQKIAIDGQDNIWATDLGNNRIQKFDSNGNFLSTFGTSGSGNGQFNQPAGIALDTSGNIFVTEGSGHRVQKFGVVLNQAETKAYVIDSSVDALFEVNLSNGNRTIISNSVTGTGTNFADPTGVVLNQAETKAYVIDSSVDALFEVNLSNGNRTIISNSVTGTGTNFANPTGVVLNQAETKAYVIDFLAQAVIESIISNGNRAIRSK